VVPLGEREREDAAAMAIEPYPALMPGRQHSEGGG